MSRYYNDELEHADREWKHHTYLKKYRGKNGKWVYVYKRKNNQVALNGNGGSTPDGSESATERISNSAHEALNRLRNKNSRASRTADIRTKSAISRTVNKAKKAAGNTANAVTKGLNDFANDTVNAQRDKNQQMERRRRATQRRRKRVIRATKTKLSTAYNNAKNKAVNKTVDYLDSLFR